MKRFVVTLIFFIGIPLMVLLGLYVWTDPFRCIHAFDISDTDNTNREYLSTELFLRNYEKQKYNSFIFSSSRGCGMNTYRWKTYLPETSKPFIFQAWSESLTGIEMKLDFLYKNNVQIDNALIMFDIPGSFDKVQMPKKALSMKHFIFTGKTRFAYNINQFYNYIQKPSLWISSVRDKIDNKKSPCKTDTISNDWDNQNIYNYTGIPDKDSLRDCSKISKKQFLQTIAYSNNQVEVSKRLINDSFKKQLNHIKSIFDKDHTDYYVVITPAYCYTHSAVNPDDLATLKEIFGNDRVYDFSGINEMTSDYNNFSDPNHFGQRVGYMILEEIYNKKE